MSLPSRTLGGGEFVNQFGRAARAERALPPDGLKTHCAQVGLGSSAERTGKDLRGMKINNTAKILWRAVNGNRRRQLPVAEQRLYAALATGLRAYATESHAEAANGWPYDEIESAECLRLAAPELRKLLRQTIDQNDMMPFSEAEQRFFGVLCDALSAYEDEVRLGHPAPERRCGLCGAPVSQCCC